MGPQLIRNSFNSSVVLHYSEICIHLKHVSKIQPKPITTQSSFEKNKNKKREASIEIQLQLRTVSKIQPKAQMYTFDQPFFLSQYNH